MGWGPGMAGLQVIHLTGLTANTLKASDRKAHIKQLIDYRRVLKQRVWLSDVL